MSRLALGTAQFGLDYGINNERGKIPEAEVAAILETAERGGIDTLDTAAAYGMSEEVIGRALKGKPAAFKIISKLPKGSAATAAGAVELSLTRLGVSGLYGYLLHDFGSFKSEPEIFLELSKLKNMGKIKKIGFSLYYPRDLEFLFDKNIEFGLVQVPYSVFDRRFEPYFPELKKRSIEVHVRSIFLQGLVFKQPAKLAPFFSPLKDKLVKLNELAGEMKRTVSELCLDFVLSHQLIDRIVVGVDRKANLEELLAAAAKGGRTIEGFQLKEEDESILLPFNWPEVK